MIATLDRLYALKEKLETVQYDTFDKEHRKPIFLSENEVALIKRLITEYISEAEEVLFEQQNRGVD